MTSGSGDTVISEAARTAHVLHRPYYAGARGAYHDRVEHYFRFPTRIFSLAIDIMESMKLQLPHAGSQTQLTNTVDSNFVGVLAHGEYLKFYRTANTVTKSASLIIHCFLSELDLWIERQQGRMPDIIYLQVDGGSENANKYMLGMIELLCVKRISKSAIYSRLPSSHSHDDQDGTFGVVKSSLKSFPMMTWDSFNEKVKECFGQGSSKLKVLVQDVFAVHDYASWLAPHIDNELERLHKLGETQHQMWFQAVSEDQFFPFGSKVLYRVHGQDVTNEGALVEKGNASTTLGHLVGIDFTRVYSRWWPNPTTIASRPVAGFSLLTSIPNEPIPLLPIKAEAIDKLKATRTYLSASIQLSAEQRADWEKFFHGITPRSDSMQDYCKQSDRVMSSLKEPLHDLLCNETARLPLFPPEVKPCVNDEDEDLKHYVENIALAMPSVKSRFDLNPPLPRMLMNDSALAVAAKNLFLSCTSESYKEYLNTKTLESLKLRMGQMVSIDGRERFTRTQTKLQRIASIIDWCTEFLLTFHRPLVLERRQFMDLVLKSQYRSVAEPDTVLCSVSPTLNVTKRFMRAMADERYVDLIMSLFYKRNDSMAGAHGRQHQQSANYLPFQQSLFCPIGLYRATNTIEHLTYTHAVYVAVQIEGLWAFVQWDKATNSYLFVPTFVVQNKDAALSSIKTRLDQALAVTAVTSREMYQLNIPAQNTVVVENAKWDPVACLERFKATPHNKSLAEAQGCVVELSIIHMFVSLCFIVHGCPLLYNLDTMLLKFCACHGALMF